MVCSGISYRTALLALLSATSVFAQNASTPTSNHTTVLILGGGMTGVIAARTLHEQGVNDFILLDAKIELGGRMIGKAFGVTGREVFVEYGPSWIHGTQQGNGPINPIWELALKHNLSTVQSDFNSLTTYDYTGVNNYTALVENATQQFTQSTIEAGRQLKDGIADQSLRSAYNLMGFGHSTPQEVASDYYQIDFSQAETSWFAASWKHNFTYVPSAGGYSNVHQMSIDPRGITYIAQAEASSFLQPQQLVLNQTVSLIEYNNNSVTVQTTGGMTITADHVLCTFSVGVLQHEDVQFQPPLPFWKEEAINSIEMATYTKIYLQFNDTFWFPTEMGLYADQQRGKYPVWQNLDNPKFFPGSGIVSVTVTGDWSIYVEQLDNAQVQSEVMEVLQMMYPNITIPEPADVHISTWAINTLYRGSFPTWGPSYQPGHSTNLKATVNNHLWFAGDATNVKQFGLLQGAYFEGLSAGQAIAGCVQGNTTSCNAFHAVDVPMNAEPYQSFLTALKTQNSS